MFARQASAGLAKIFFELKGRAICLIEDFRFGKDFFGKFFECHVCMHAIVVE